MPPKKPNPLRVIRKNKSGVVNRVSKEVWELIVVHMFDSVKKVFMLCTALRGLAFSPETWHMILTRHQLYLEHTPKMRRNPVRAILPPRPHRCLSVLRLYYGSYCQSCGCRWRHSVRPAFCVRMCTNCWQDRHVSSVVLWHEYGISVRRLDDDNVIPYVRHHGLRTYNCRQVLQYSRNRLDYDFRGKFQRMVFFWRPDLERLYSLDRSNGRAAVRAAQVISAVIKRSFVISFRRDKYKCEPIYVNEVRRVTHRLWYTDAPGFFGRDFTRHSYAAKNVPFMSEKEFVKHTALDHLDDEQFRIFRVQVARQNNRAIFRAGEPFL